MMGHQQQFTRPQVTGKNRVALIAGSLFQALAAGGHHNLFSHKVNPQRLAAQLAERLPVITMG